MVIEKIVFRRPAYVEWLKQVTYPSVAILAIQKGSLDGCWESLIGAQLMNDCCNQNHAAFDTMEDLGFSVFTKEVWYQAGEMILNNDEIEL